MEMEAREGWPPIALPSFRLKKILLPVDFSLTSRKAVAYAASFARQFSAEVLLLHVIEPIPMAPQPDMLPIMVFGREIRAERARRLSQWRSEFRPRASVTAILREGVAHHEIVAMAREDDVDLIVIGTQGRTGWSHLFGSTAEWVVRHAPCPVLVVREREHDFVQPA